MTAGCLRRPDDGVVLAGVKAKPSGWPSASLDPGCRRPRTSPCRNQPKITNHKSQVFTVSGDCRATGLAIRACQAGHRVLFATATEWVTRLADAHHAGRLHDELRRLGRYPLLVIDEVGYIPFEPEAANLFFQLISARYERASLIVTSNKPFGRWGEVFGDDIVAAAMIDRLVHHAEIIALKGDSYRLKDRNLGRVPAATTEEP